jgi:predicted rRNA methylase YqxC with S4 and FtsJ domains
MPGRLKQLKPAVYLSSVLVANGAVVDSEKAARAITAGHVRVNGVVTQSIAASVRRGSTVTYKNKTYKVL